MRVNRKLVAHARLAAWVFGLPALCCLLGELCVAAADVDEGRKLFESGQYSECIRMAQQAIKEWTRDEEWPKLLIKAQLAVGSYPEAQRTVEDALNRYPGSFSILLLAYEVFRANSRSDRADEILNDMNTMGGARRRFYRNAETLVAMGRAALLLNADPKLVLENFFDQAKRSDPDCREAYQASGELALDKHDYALAAKTFNEALKKFPDDLEAKYGLARAYAPSDQGRMALLLNSVLTANTNHTPAMLLLADHLIDAEEYAETEKTLARALRVNPWLPEAWAYRAVLAHLRNDTNAEATARQTALKYWTNNPRVDYLIGEKLSQNYRFKEGAAYQQRALEFDPDYLPAKIQLAQDDLRLGNETEGWQLAEEVHSKDGYDVTAYNLVTLRQTMSKFKTVTNQSFIVRMSPREADIYGDRVLELLQKALERLSVKYGYHPDRPTVVEVFPEQKDFGVRTFGMPHNPGFLGVCFGHVVTANSPAAQQGHPENWEDVLWHEFCHVITLGITRNRMPRWLSEGISVYEERQANPAWGEKMNPRYREMILGEDFTPISDLSAAFLSPKSSLHVQFAYFESSLVVEYLVQTFGPESLKQILRDLGDGADIKTAITRSTAPMEKVEADFAAFARERAKSLAPGLDWTRPDEPDTNNATNGSSASLSQPANNTNSPPLHPVFAPNRSADSTNYWDLVAQARTAMDAKKWAEAKAPLQKLIALCPTQSGPGNAYAMLAAAHRGLNETEQEREVLGRLAAIDSDDTDAYMRLMELDDAAKDPQGVATSAECFIAVNPLAPQPYRYLARAAEALGRNDSAIRCYQRLLLFDPPDPADVHFHLARLWRQSGDNVKAKRQVLQALEEAPRFHDAQRLLLEIENGSTTDAPAGDAHPITDPGFK